MHATCACVTYRHVHVINCAVLYTLCSSHTWDYGDFPHERVEAHVAKMPQWQGHWRAETLWWKPLLLNLFEQVGTSAVRLVVHASTEPQPLVLSGLPVMNACVHGIWSPKCMSFLLQNVCVI